jgi:GNAT superfamily N-acetyltransferase
MDGALRTGWYDGDRAVLRALFEEAEDSSAQLDAYVDDGRVVVTWLGDDPVGHLQLVETGRDGEVELKNMAVADRLRGQGVGRGLVEAAITTAHDDGHRRMVVATAAADTGNLRFYQRCGFRFTRIERDFFGPETGYPDEVVIDGITLRDRVWFDREL